MTLTVIWHDLWKPRQVHKADKYIQGGTFSSKYKLRLKCPEVLVISMETNEWPIKGLYCSGEAAAAQARLLRVPNTALATYTFISSPSWQQCKLHNSNFFFSLLTTCESVGWRFRWRKLFSRCLDQVQANLPAVDAYYTCIHDTLGRMCAQNTADLTGLCMFLMSDYRNRPVTLQVKLHAKKSELHLKEIFRIWVGQFCRQKSWAQLSALGCLTA